MWSSWHSLIFFHFLQHEMLGCLNCCFRDVLSWGQLRAGHILQNSVWVSLVVSHSTSPSLPPLQTCWWALSGQWLGKKNPIPIPSFDYNKICCGYENICILWPLPAGQQTAWSLHMWLFSDRHNWVWSSPHWKQLKAFLKSQWLLCVAHFCDEKNLLSRQRMHLFSQRLQSSHPRSIHTFTHTTDKRDESKMGCSQVASWRTASVLLFVYIILYWATVSPNISTADNTDVLVVP